MIDRNIQDNPHMGKNEYYKDGKYEVTKLLNGGIVYHLNGQLHRAKGLPAIEWNDGKKEWWKKSKRHNLIGPAIIYADGRKAWYLEGIEYEEPEWEKDKRVIKALRKLKFKALGI